MSSHSDTAEISTSPSGPPEVKIPVGQQLARKPGRGRQYFDRIVHLWPGVAENFLPPQDPTQVVLRDEFRGAYPQPNGVDHGRLLKKPHQESGRQGRIRPDGVGRNFKIYALVEGGTGLTPVYLFEILTQAKHFMGSPSKPPRRRRPVFIANFRPPAPVAEGAGITEEEVSELDGHQADGIARPALRVVRQGLRYNFPPAGPVPEGGHSDGYCYRAPFAAGKLPATYELIRSFLKEEGYADVPPARGRGRVEAFPPAPEATPPTVLIRGRWLRAQPRENPVSPPRPASGGLWFLSYTTSPNRAICLNSTADNGLIRLNSGFICAFTRLWVRSMPKNL